MIDEPDDLLDFQVATHIVSVHQKKDQAFTAPYTMRQLQQYIRFARTFKPRMSAEVSFHHPPLKKQYTSAKGCDRPEFCALASL